MDPHNSNSDSNDSSSSNDNGEQYRQMYMHLVNNLLLDPADEKILEIIHAWMEQRGESSSLRPPRNMGPLRFIPRDRVVGNQRLIDNYFSDNPVHYEDIFWRRFRMRRHLFLSIVQTLGERYSFFAQRVDATGLPSLSPLQKCTAAIRQLAYGGPADMFDEYIRIGESTSTKCLKFFCHAIVTVYGERYLRRPTEEDLQRLHDMHLRRHGFLDMLGSVDCMHWQWRNCPNAWKEKFTRGDQGVPIILESLASVDLWIWNAFFGVAGSNNDINVLNQSNLFNDVLRGTAPALDFFVNGRHYRRGYYLADGIYPEWASFVKSYTCPTDQKRGYFKQRQESARKDVECAFEVLQAIWAIVRGPARNWYRSDIKNIMHACVILHNMIVEDEGDQVSNWSGDQVESPVQATQGVEEQYIHLMHRYRELRDRDAHHRLRADLVEHLWATCDFNDI